MATLETFNNLVSRPYKFTLDERHEILDAIEKYPFCAPLQILDLASSKACGISSWKYPYSKARLYTSNEKHLNSLLETVIDIEKPRQTAPAQPLPQTPEPDTKAVEPAEDFDIINEINAYQEVSFKTAPKSVILNEFLESGPQFNTNIVPDSSLSVEELAKKSILANDSLDTETMAVIYEAQQKYDKAIEIYERLIAHNPEKSSIFAVRISSLKNKIENK